MLIICINFFLFLSNNVNIDILLDIFFYIFASNEIYKIFRVYEPPELHYGFWKIISVLVLIRCEDLSLEIKLF